MKKPKKIKGPFAELNEEGRKYMHEQNARRKTRAEAYSTKKQARADAYAKKKAAQTEHIRAKADYAKARKVVQIEKERTRRALGVAGSASAGAAQTASSALKTWEAAILGNSEAAEGTHESSTGNSDGTGNTTSTTTTTRTEPGITGGPNQ